MGVNKDFSSFRKISASHFSAGVQSLPPPVPHHRRNAELSNSGRSGGRPPKLRPEQRQHIVDAVLSGDQTAAAMARRYRVSEATVSRLLAAERASGAGAFGSGRDDAGASPENDVAGVLPLSALNERLAIVGTSGSGKTYAAKGLLEPVIQSGGRVCVVDPLGVWWGLKAAADEGPAPFPVTVFGGDHADVPLDLSAAAALGRLIAQQRLACVVDLSGFGTGIARRTFMTSFTAALHAANTEPLHLVLDEADLWAPQRAQPDGGELLGRIEEIVRRGRVRGFVPWLITQRPAVLHKDVLSQADVMIAMKLTSAQDRGAIGNWIEGQADRLAGRNILAALPRLRQGEGWVWAPTDGVLLPARFPKIRTRDTSATPRRPMRAEAGSDALAAADPDALRQALAGLSEKAEEEILATGTDGRANIAELAHTVRQLQAGLARAQARLSILEQEQGRQSLRLV